MGQSEELSEQDEEVEEEEEEEALEGEEGQEKVVGEEEAGGAEWAGLWWSDGRAGDTETSVSAMLEQTWKQDTEKLVIKSSRFSS